MSRVADLSLHTAHPTLFSTLSLSLTLSLPSSAARTRKYPHRTRSPFPARCCAVCALPTGKKRRRARPIVCSSFAFTRQSSFACVPSLTHFPLLIHTHTLSLSRHCRRTSLTPLPHPLPPPPSDSPLTVAKLTAPPPPCLLRRQHPQAAVASGLSERPPAFFARARSGPRSWYSRRSA